MQRWSDQKWKNQNHKNPKDYQPSTTRDQCKTSSSSSSSLCVTNTSILLHNQTLFKVNIPHHQIKKKNLSQSNSLPKSNDFTTQMDENNHQIYNLSLSRSKPRFQLRDLVDQKNSTVDQPRF